MARISPILFLVIVILAIGFFILGLLQLLIRCLTKRPSFSSISQSNRFPDNSSNSHTFQRQLQQLFRLHDSGLERSSIDALRVFYYKDIMWSKEPFDCAVCLCEFSDSDKLKFLPDCSHAFHIQCIETWLLSNSTCPLCRTVIGPVNSMGNPFPRFDDSIEQWSFSCPNGGNESRENAAPARVFSVRLGKFRSLNEGLDREVREHHKGLEREDREHNEVGSSSTIDARRCYSMGAFQYIVGEENLQVAVSSGDGGGAKGKLRCNKGQLGSIAEMDGKKIDSRSRGDSFSVSKIWLWSEKSKFPTSLDGNESVVLPMPRGSIVV